MHQSNSLNLDIRFIKLLFVKDPLLMTTSIFINLFFFVNLTNVNRFSNLFIIEYLGCFAFLY